MKIKLVRESENIGEKDDELSILKFSKTASQKNISPKQSGDDVLIIKSDKKVSDDDDN